VDAERLTFEELEDELASLASHLYAGMCRWLDLVAELDRRGGLSACTSAEWLAWRCGLTPRTAREHLRVARRLAELPLIRDAFGRGQVSFAKVRALTRIAEPESEQDLLDLALQLTAAQLERAVRAYRRVTAEEAVALQDAAYVGWYWDENGSLVIRGQLAPEDGALVLQALDAAHAALRERGSAEPRTTNAQALAAMAELALSGGAATAGARHQVVVHVDESALAHDGEGGCELDEGPSIAPETARRLACDSSVVGRGRRTRSIPPAIRRALKRRDRGCRFPGCENHLFVDAHHIRHWAQGGETRLDNLVLLCRRHHRLVHEGGYVVERLPDDELRFRDPRGAPLANAPRPPPGSVESILANGAGAYALAWPDRMDLDLAVQALLAATV
jgi:5-methylcytosine-specific restriction endonuclease McrA